MGLTRTRFLQSNTVIAKIQDPITVLNSDSTVANIDVGFVVNRNSGINSNAAIYWNETNSEFRLALTSNTGVINSNIAVGSYANLRVGTLFGNLSGVTTADIESLRVTGTTNTTGLGTGTLILTQGGAAVQKDLYVGGNIYAGNLISSGTYNIVVEDPLLYLTANSIATYNYEIGFYSQFIGGALNNYQHTGFVRNHVDNQWYLFSNIPEPEGGTVDLGNASITYDTLRAGGLYLVNTTPSTSTTTGALTVGGGAGIAGSIYGGDQLVIGGINVLANIGAYQTYANANITAIQANIGSYQTYANANVTAIQANLGAYQTWANNSIASLYTNANANTAAYLTTYTGNIQTGNLVATANVYASGVVSSTYYGNFNLGTTSISLSRASASQTLTGISIDGSAESANTANIATYSTNSNNSQITSNISAGTAYIPFVKATSGYSPINVNTSLTINPSTGNVSAYGLITTTGLFWSNGTAFTSGSNYGNTEVAAYLVNGTGNIAAANVTTTGKLLVNDTTNAVPYVMGSGAVHIAGGMSIAKDLWMGGNLYVANIVSESSTILEVADPLVYLNSNSAIYNYDIGLFSDFIGGPLNNYQYTAAVRSYQTSTWSFVSNIEKPANGRVNFANTSLIWDTIKAGGLILANTEISSSTSTGALVVSGGAGIGGALYIANTGDVSANIGTLFLGNASTNANLGSYQTWANAAITSLYTNANANTASYLTTYTGNIQAGNITVTGNIRATSNVFANLLYVSSGLRWAGNGAAISTGGGTGTGTTYTANTAPPTTGNVSGDMWYNTATDTLYEYLNDGTSQYWVDVQSLGTTGNITTISDATLQGNLIVGLSNVYSIGTSTGFIRNLFANTTIISNLVADVATISNLVANVSSVSNLSVTVTANLGNVITTNGVFWANGNAYSSGSGTNKATVNALIWAQKIFWG